MFATKIFMLFLSLYNNSGLDFNLMKEVGDINKDLKVNCVGKDSWTKGNSRICFAVFRRRIIRRRKHSDCARSGRWSLRKHPRTPLIRRCNELFSGIPRSSSAVHRAIMATECITFPPRSTWCIRVAFPMCASRLFSSQEATQYAWAALLITDNSLFRDLVSVWFYFYDICVHLLINLFNLIQIPLR